MSHSSESLKLQEMVSFCLKVWMWMKFYWQEKEIPAEISICYCFFLRSTIRRENEKNTLIKCKYFVNITAVFMNKTRDLFNNENMFIIYADHFKGLLVS